MATLTGAQGANLEVEPGQFFERDIVWLRSAGTYGATDVLRAAALLAAVQVIGQYWSISIIGTPSTTGCIFGCHGPAALTDLTTIEAEMDVAVPGQALSVVTLTGIALA